MPDMYVQLDVNYQDDPKILDVPVEAELLYVRSLCLAKRLLSDGFVDRRQLRRLGEGIERAEELALSLEGAGLWIPVEGGWLIHAWLDHNKSREQIEADRKAERERKAAWRRKVPMDATESPTGQESESQGTKSLATDSRDRDRVKVRASAPPPDFAVDDELRKWAAEKHPGVDLDREREKWLLWCVAEGRTYKNHRAGFQTWVGRAKPMLPMNGNGSREPTSARLDLLGTRKCQLGVCSGNGWLEAKDGTISRCRCLTMKAVS